MENLNSAPILSLAELSSVRKSLKNVVLAGGAFDILHGGHIIYLKTAKSRGEILIVHVVGDDRVREKKGANRPLLPQDERAAIVAAVRFVDYVFIYNGRHYDQEIISKLQPDILFFNQDGYLPAVKEKVKNLQNFRGRVVVDRQEKINHSSQIIDALEVL